MRFLVVALVVVMSSGVSFTLTASSKAFNLKRIERLLINSKGKPVKNANLKDKKYILVYYSAHWCPPCRAFTPKLVKFYKECNKGDFEVIFVSFDRSEKAQLEYMTEMDMPWPAVKLSKIKRSGLLAYSGQGIPCLVMFKPDGTIVSDTNENGRYLGPQKVLADLKKLLEKD